MTLYYAEPEGIYSQVSEVIDLPDSERVIWRTVGISAAENFLICNETNTESDLFEADYEEDIECSPGPDRPMIVRVVLQRVIEEQDSKIHMVKLVTGNCTQEGEFVLLRGMQLGIASLPWKFMH